MWPILHESHRDPNHPVQRWCAKAFFATAGGCVMVVTPELRAQILRLYLADQWRVGTIATNS
jgi:hypothetical protein